MDCKLQNLELKCYLPIARARRIWRFWLEKHRLKGLQHSNSVCENAICQQKSVEEVDVEETQVCQPLKQPFRRGISNLRNLQRKSKEIEYKNTFFSQRKMYLYLTLQVLKVLENLISTSSLNRLGSLFTH